MYHVPVVVATVGTWYQVRGTGTGGNELTGTVADLVLPGILYMICTYVYVSLVPGSAIMESVRNSAFALNK